MYKWRFKSQFELGLCLLFSLRFEVSSKDSRSLHLITSYFRDRLTTLTTGKRYIEVQPVPSLSLSVFNVRGVGEVTIIKYRDGSPTTLSLLNHWRWTPSVRSKNQEICNHSFSNTLLWTPANPSPDVTERYDMEHRWQETTYKPNTIVEET